jgi:hypothetical protein
MHHLKRVVVPSVVACAALFAVALPALADSVSCEGVPHWNSDHRYKNGERAWHHEGGNSYYLYACNQTECVGAGSNEPSYSSKVWKFIGSCKDTPH